MAKKSTTDRDLQINAGTIETKNLAEALAVDFTRLHRAIFADAPKSVDKDLKALQSAGILKRMADTATLLTATHGAEAFKTLKSHASDTARGWAAFMVGQMPAKNLAARLKLIKPFADDSHFGVREWAWMAVRTHIAADLSQAIEILSTWTDDKSPRVRRFATEATRPRGVWAAHIQALKDDPALGLDVLTPLKSDDDRYVQDSVANWLNDAAKTQPQWVKKLCAAWIKESDTKATAYIVKKAQRSLK